MRFRHLSRALSQGAGIAVLLGSLGLAACGSSNNGATDIKNIIIASELPTSGSDQAVGTATENGVKLAVMEAQLSNGYSVSFQSFNDASVALGKHDPAQGQKNMQQIVATPDIMGVVGAFNSGVSSVEIPIVQQSGGPVMISPANTNPGLTIAQYATANGFNPDTLHPPGKPNFYFRIPANDVTQGGLLAKIALAPPPTSIGAKTAFVLDDGEVYGQGLAQFFSSSFTQGGGKLLGTETTISKDQCSNFSSLATNIVSLKPDVIFFGGTTGAGAGCLKAAVAAKGGAKIPWAVGDGVADNSDWFNEAGAAAVGIFGTVAAPDLTKLTSASAFVSDYQSHFGAAPYPYSAIAYDAANIEIQAIKNLIAAGKPVNRLSVRDQVASISYKGVTGTISFDSNGDNSGTKYFSVWAVLPASPTTWTLEQNVDASSA